MKIVVQGLWHLGCVTAACTAQHHQVVGLDFDTKTVDSLRVGKAPLYEPGLDDLIQSGLAGHSLSFETDPGAACAGADILWLCYDTPVNENDQADASFVLENLKRSLPHLPSRSVILISSQLRVGTCRQLEAEFPSFKFACSPENLRLGKAIEAFTKADRVIIGHRESASQDLFGELFKPFTSQILFMRTESAEMVKHALNSFLALSVTFINEVARLCERTGADAREVAAGLKSEPRIGQRAYLGPGGPFAGGTLARDVVTLIELSSQTGENVPLISAIKISNDQHRHWNLQRLKHELGDLQGKTIVIFGLTYKPGTNTLRRSAAIELCQDLLKCGAIVRAVDPVVKALPNELSGVSLLSNASEAVAGADAAVLCTEWPEFRQLPWADLAKQMKGNVVLDANAFLRKELKDLAAIHHVAVGA